MLGPTTNHGDLSRGHVNHFRKPTDLLVLTVATSFIRNMPQCSPIEGTGSFRGTIFGHVPGRLLARSIGILSCLCHLVFLEMTEAVVHAVI